MEERIFGKHTLAQLESLKRNPADGGAFYLALQEAAPGLFALAKEHEKLAGAVQKLVTAAETVTGENNVASISSSSNFTLEKLSTVLGDPALKKFTTP